MANFLSQTWRKAAALTAASAVAVTAIACNGETPTSPTGGGITVVPAPTPPVTPPTSTFVPAPNTTKELRDLIEALYFCSGAKRSDTCNSIGTTFGLDPTPPEPGKPYRYTIRISDSFDDRARERIVSRVVQALSKSVSINPVPEFFNQRSVYNISAPPAAPDNTITILETKNPSADCNATAAACATWFFAPDGRTINKATILKQWYDSTETHEALHLGLNHTSSDESVMFPQVSWHTQESEMDVAARAAVKAAGLDKPNVTKADFLAAGLINPVAPIPNSARTQVMVSAPPGHCAIGAVCVIN